MNTMEYHPRFQLAFRRTIFFSIFLISWILFGTLCFSLFISRNQDRSKLSFAEENTDVRRTELLNVLWAEAVSQSEEDWYEAANRKMELHEQRLLATRKSFSFPNVNSISRASRKAFYLISLIGPGDVSEFSRTEQLFAIFYILIGAPLFLIVLAQVNKMISTIWKGSTIIWPTFFFIIICSILYDSIYGDEDEYFMDAVFTVFLIFTTIGEEENEASGFPFLILCLMGVCFLSTTFVCVQHELERNLHGIELTFNRVFSVLERYMSEKEESNNAYHTIIEEDEEEEEEEEEEN